jgi:hypothetical protein
VTEPSKHLKGGRYVLVRKLGEGSQGETYEAIDNGTAPPPASPSRPRRLADEWERYLLDAKGGPAGKGEVVSGERRVAIKCFRVGQAKAWKDVELAEREAETLAALDHPNLPKYIEHFEEDGALYLVMEKIEGESLAAIRTARRKRPWSADEVTKLLEDSAEALRYLHGQSPVVVHRDIKPGNIIRRPDGSYAIVDFGSVRDRLKPGGGSTVVGTFGYMAPEQFQGRASPRSDVYGVGATAMAMLTGLEPEELPHTGLGIDVRRAVPRGTPAPLVKALEAMLLPDPDARAESIDDALALLAKREKPKRRHRGKEDRDEKRARKRASRAAKDAAWAKKKATWAQRRGHPVPLVPRVIARLGLLVAMVAVWLAVGIAVPFVLAILSLVFGGALRRAAAACVRATRRSQAAIDRASAWLSGEAPPPEARVRVEAASDDETQARIATDDAASLPLEEADEWLGEQLRSRDLRAGETERMRLHARPPGKAADPKRRFWGR